MSGRKPQKRARSKRSPVERLRPFWILFVLVAVAAAGAGYWAATWPGFFPRSVTVGGNRIVPSAEILERAGIERSQNVWLQNMQAAANRVAAIPYVKEAHVYRELPASVRIEISERAPFAIVRYARNRVLVDSDLRVLEIGEGAQTLPVFAASGEALPVPGVFLRDADTMRLRSDFETLARAHVAAAELGFDRFGDLIVTMPSGVRLLLGDDEDIEQKAALIPPILAQVSASGRRVAAVDLRAPKTPVVRFSGHP